MRKRSLQRRTHRQLVKVFKATFGESPLPMMEPAELLDKAELIEHILAAQDEPKPRRKNKRTRN